MFYQIFFIIGYSTSVFGNFYEILGVSRSATDFDIKNSYKKLARIWHPDKNKSPEANDHFTKINEAYEALSHPDKRREYDAFGSISNEPRNNGNYGGGGGFSNAYFDFGENDQTESNFESTNYRHYKIDILPNSFQQPTLILLVSHFCFSCHHAMRLWNSIGKQITESGIRIALADVMTDAYLREEIQIQHVPTVVMIIGGQVRFMQSEINKETVIDFIRYSFPSYLVQSIQSDDDLKDFHNLWLKDSRAKMIMAKPLDRPSFRYLSIAFKYRDKISAGFIHLDNNDDQFEQIISNYGLKTNQETVVIFHDETHTSRDGIILPKQIDKIAKARLSLSDIDRVVQSNYLLPLPRLLSQSVFDRACPPPSQRQRSPGFCVITVIDSRHRDNLSESDSWRTVRSKVGHLDHSKVVYLFADVQYQFLQSLRLVDPDQSSVGTFTDQVILLWRQSYTSASSLLLSNPWQNSNIDLVLNDLDLLSDIDSAISILKPKRSVSETQNLSPLVDELAPPLWMKMLSTVIGSAGQIYSYLYDLLSEPFNLVIAVIGLGLVSYLFSTIKASIMGQRNDKQSSHSNHSQQQKPSNRDRVAELTEEWYQSLIKHVQPGQLICVLLTTKETPPRAVELLRDSVAKLSDSRLLAACLPSDRNPLWLSSLFAQMSNCDDHRSGLSSVDALSVNRPFAYEGVVLALNIGRCYLSICPVNLTRPIDRAATDDGGTRRRPRTTAGVDLDSSDSDSSSVEVAATNVDGRFFDWLCQLTEGTCRRYHVSRWPSTL